MKLTKLTLIIILHFRVLDVNSQTPFKINTTTGLHAVDISSNPILNDKNWNLTPVYNEEFNNEPSVQSNWYYLPPWGRSIKGSEFFQVTGFDFLDNITNDNCLSSTASNTYNAFSNTYNREFSTTTSSPICSYVKLINRLVI